MDQTVSPSTSRPPTPAPGGRRRPRLPSPAVALPFAMLLALPLALVQLPAAAAPQGAAAQATSRAGSAPGLEPDFATGSATPPLAEQRPVERTLHGVRMVDPWAWLRDKENPEVIAHLQAENAYTEAILAPTEELQETLYGELVARLRENDLSVPFQKDGWFYYEREEKGLQYPILARKRGSLDAPEEIVLDLNALAEGEDYFRIGAMEISPDHRHAAYSVDTDGSESYTLHVRNLETGEDLAEAIPGTTYSLAWGNDSRTFFYTVHDAAKRPHEVRRHVLGTPHEEDVTVHREDDERFFLDVSRTRSGQYLVLNAESSITNELRVLDADTPRGEFRVLAPRRQGVEMDLDHRGEHFYLRTNEDAQDFQLVRMPVSGSGETEVVIPHRPGITLSGVDLFAGHTVLSEREAGLRRLRIVDAASGESHQVEMPETVATMRLQDNVEFDTETLRFGYTSMVTPRSVYDYHMGTRELTLLKRVEVPGYDPADYRTERIYARAADGLAVPATLVYRKDLDLGPETPCMLMGYGAYGATADPSFSPRRLPLLERGFVFATAHPRGSSMLGEAWHEGGRMENKANTFTDFIAVAEQLIAQRYTSADKLAITGGSAGGLLMGAVLNLRPELFEAALVHVPFVDVMNTMLDPTLPLTVIEYEEWGNPNEAEAFRTMLAYSPYENVSSQAYPAMLVTAGLNDPRVGYWEPAKWVSRLRTTATGDEPLLFQIEMGAGHGGASGRYDALREEATHLAFVLTALGEQETPREGAPLMRSVGEAP